MRKRNRPADTAAEPPLSYSLLLKLRKNDDIFGPGVLQLLLLVDETHSLNSACARMNMAYSKAWRIIKTAEKQLGCALLTRKIGGEGGGGSELTPRARDLTERYLKFQTEAYRLADRLFAEIFPKDLF